MENRVSVKIREDAVLLAVYVVAVALIAAVDCMTFMRTGTITPLETIWSIGCVVGLVYYARKLRS